jgi:c-di-GMP-binding flagellar brake protein YcgR
VAVSLPGVLRGRSERSVEVVDLSLTGCLLRCPAALEPGSIHDLLLSLGRGSFQAKARVTETSLDGSAVDSPELKYLIGVEFLRLAARDQAALREFIDAEFKRRVPAS